MVNWPLEDERQLLAWACQENFETFCRVGLGFTHPKNKKGRWWSDEVHQPLCAWFQEQVLDWLEHRHERHSRKFIGILVPRACAKSLLITQAGMLWAHLRDPNLSTYLGNEKLELAEAFLGTVKKWLEGTEDEYCLFNWLYGVWRGDTGKWRSDSIVHGARRHERSEPSFGVWSPNSALTGRHPDIVCMDDLVSYDALKKDINWFEYAYSHMTDLIPVVESNGLVILVGTRYSDADPFGRSFKSDGIRTLAGHTDFDEYKAIPAGRWHVYFLSGRKQPTPDYPTGEPAIPTVWPENEILFYESRDPIKAASQILNRPRAHKLRAMTEEQFDSLRIDKLPDPKTCTVVFHLDTAFKSNKKLAGGSETALAVCAHHDLEPGRLTVIDAHCSIAHRAETFADLIIDRYRTWTARGYTVAGITDEAEMAGKAGLWFQYLSDRFIDANLEMPTPYTFQRQTGEKKEVRIAAAIHFVVAGQVKFYNGCEAILNLRDQLANHPNAFPNDLADCFADTFSPEFFTGFLPRLKAVKEPYQWGAHEQRLKKGWNPDYDTIDRDEASIRPPIRRGSPGTDASSVQVPFSERGVAPPSFFPGESWQR
jgi:hypothetical protein